jgi:exodeoxyribonuclease VII large subunit
MQFDDKSYYTVSELNEEVRGIIEDEYPEVSVLGEISNFKRHNSGHLYFTLKDSDSQLRTVCFRRDAQRVAIDLDDGIKVFVHGRLTLYEAYGQYQLVASVIEAAGVGELEVAFRKLCDRLEGEGLFEAEHKLPLPAYPFKIAVITSPTGAAVRDITSSLQRRWPCAEILLVPVRVQGETAAGEIVRALEIVENVAGLDLVITGRGGGSLEDLWSFNEEIVARAIYDCSIPLISAVGHETDFTISDFVADARAATPTMAAEIAVPHADEVQSKMDERLGRLIQSIRRNIDLRRAKLQELLRSYGLGQVKGQVESRLQKHDYLMEKLTHRMREIITARWNELNEKTTRLRALDATAVMKRGYAICSDLETGGIIRSVSGALAAGDVRITLSDGSVSSRVKEEINERS